MATSSSGVCTKNSDSDVLVMQPTEQRTRDDAPNLLDRARDRSNFVQRLVSSDFIVIACVGLQGQPQVRLAKRDEWSAHSRRIDPINRSAKACGPRPRSCEARCPGDD